MNSKAFAMTNTTQRDFKLFCKANGFRQKDPEAKKVFFGTLMAGKKIKDEKGKYLVVNRKV